MGAELNLTANSDTRLFLLKQIFLFMRSLIQDEQGQATTEYILMIALAVGSAALIGRTILTALDNGILYLGAELERTLKTGRVKVSVWTN